LADFREPRVNEKSACSSRDIDTRRPIERADAGEGQLYIQAEHEEPRTGVFGAAVEDVPDGRIRNARGRLLRTPGQPVELARGDSDARIGDLDGRGVADACHRDVDLATLGA
jgi:hypothetical protein